MKKKTVSIVLKTTILLCSLLFPGFWGNAQAPGKMSYQGVLRDDSHNPIENASVNFRLSILNGSTDGMVVYSETQLLNTGSEGLFHAEIGGGSPVTGDFNSIDWAGGNYFLKIEVDLSGGSDFVLLGINQLLTVPFAFYAQTAGNGFSGKFEDLTGVPDFSMWDQNKADDFSGNYNDLSNKPNLFNGSWSSLTGKPSFATVATSGSYMDLTHIPAAWDSTYTSLKGKPNLALYATKDMGNQNITNLASPVSDKDAANKAYVDALNNRLDELMKIIAANGLKTIMDVDGNLYDTVTIGTQVWLTENLKVTHYRNGEAINNITTDNSSWQGASGGAYSWYDNDVSNKDKFGALYNWYAVTDSRGMCPTGFHVPTDAEWQTLEIFLGIPTFDANFVGWRGVDEGGQLKEVSYDYWDDASTASNTSGFSARGGGLRESNGDFNEILFTGGWWTSSGYSTNMAWYREIFSYNENITRYYDLRTQGRSVRCVK